jgi:alpha-tubulin suppressor-like RCC1 family protein
VSLGSDFGAALKLDGSLFVWGASAVGQSGLNSTISRSSPTQIAGTYIDLCATNQNLYAIDTVGNLWFSGLAGGNPDANVNVSSFTQSSSFAGWKGIKFGGSKASQGAIIYALPVATPAPTSSPTPSPTSLALFAWGDNAVGQIGNNSVVDLSSPVQIGNYTPLRVINSQALSTTGFIQYDGTVIGWGQNASGQLGLNNIISVSSPIQLALTNVKDIRFGCSIMCNNDGTLWTWGSNSYGQNGQNDVINRSSPVQVSIGALSAVQVCNHTDSCGWVSSTGLAYVSGRNENGMFGLNNTVSTSSFVQCSITDVRSMAMGARSVLWNTNTNQLWIAGGANNGTLGNNTVIDVSSPIQITGNWSKVAVSNETVAAIKTDGTLWTWGYGLVGAIGNNAGVNQSSPVQIAGTWTDVSNSVGCVKAIKLDGTLWTWGQNTNGELGNNNTVNSSSPIQVGIATDWNLTQNIGSSSYGWK